MSDRECILEKLSNDFGLNCYGSSEQMGRKTSHSATLSDTQRRKRSVTLAGLQMEIPEITEKNVEQNRYSEEGGSSVKVSGNLFPVLNRTILKPSGASQASQGLGRIVLCSVGGIQNALMHSGQPKGSITAKNQTLVPFEIHEGGGMPVASSNLAGQEPVLAVRDGIVSTGKLKEISLRSKARNETVSLRQNSKPVKIGGSRGRKAVKNVVINNKTFESKLGVHIETRQAMFPTLKCHGPIANTTHFIYPTNASSSETNHFVSRGTGNISTPIENLSECAKKSPHLKNDHSYTTNSVNSSRILLPGLVTSRSEAVKGWADFASEIHAETIARSKAVSTVMPLPSERDNNVLGQASKKLSNTGASESAVLSENETVLYSSDDELSAIGAILKTGNNSHRGNEDSGHKFKIPLKSHRATANSDEFVNVESGFGLKTTNSIPSPQNQQIGGKKSAERSVLNGLNKKHAISKNDTDGKRNTAVILRSQLEMPGLIKAALQNNSGHADKAVYDDKKACRALQSALYSALNSQSKVSVAQKEQLPKNTVPSTSIAASQPNRNSASWPTVINSSALADASVRSYMNAVSEIYQKISKKSRNIGHPKENLVSDSDPDIQFHRDKAKTREKEDDEFRRKVLLVSGEHSSRTLGFCPSDLSSRRKGEKSDNASTQLGLVVLQDETRNSKQKTGEDDDQGAVESSQNAESFQEDKHRIDDKRGKFQCPFCRKLFYTKSHFVDHTRTHSVCDIFPCPTCGRSYSTSIGLEKHVLIHDPQRLIKNCQFHCKLCNRTFKYGIPYQKHMFRHKSSGTGLFTCEKCNFSVNGLNKINRHMRQDHRDEKRYKCGRCARLFFFKENLSEHKKTHNDSNSPSVCVTGKQKFSAAAELKSDDDSLQTEFSCKICGRFYSKKNSYTNHMRLKHHNVPFKAAVQSPWKSAKFIDANDQEPQYNIEKTLEPENASEDSAASLQTSPDNEDVTPGKVADSPEAHPTLASKDSPPPQNCKIGACPTPDNVMRSRAILNTAFGQEKKSEEDYAEKQISDVAFEFSQNKEQILADPESSTFSSQSLLSSSPSSTGDESRPNPEKAEERRCGTEMGKNGELTKKESSQQKTRKKPRLKRSKSDEKKTPKSKKSRSFSYEVRVESESKQDDTRDVALPVDSEPQVEISFGQYVFCQGDKSSPDLTVEVKTNIEEGDMVEQNQEMPLPSDGHSKDTSRTSFLCDVCSEIFVTVESFEKHLINHIEENPDAIEARNAIEQLREKHGANVDCSVKISAMNIFECEECKKTFSSEKIFVKHKKKHEKENANHSLQMPTDIKATESDDIEKNIDKYFVKHSTEMETFPCPKCLCFFTNESHLKNHVDIQHAKRGSKNRLRRSRQRRKKILDPTSQYTCNVCGRQFKTSRTYNSHWENHENGAYACTICGTVILLLNNVRRHIQSHFEIENDISSKAAEKKCISVESDDRPKKRGRRSLNSA